MSMALNPDPSGRHGFCGYWDCGKQLHNDCRCTASILPAARKLAIVLLASDLSRFYHNAIRGWACTGRSRVLTRPFQLYQRMQSL